MKARYLRLRFGIGSMKKINEYRQRAHLQNPITVLTLAE